MEQQTFHISFIFPKTKDDLSSDEKMTDYSIRNCWLNMLRGLTKPIDVKILANANIRSCFPIIDNPTNNFSETWRRVILREISKTDWVIVNEYGESVLDTVTDVVGDGGLLEE